MKRRRFLIPSLLMAGIAPVPPSQAALPDGLAAGGNDPDEDALINRFAQEHSFQLAQHRSHSSHASHSSHRSGSSGRVRTPVYSPPAPRKPKATPAPSPSRNSRSTPPSSLLPSSPAIAPSSDPSADAIREVVRKVQLGLMAYGYYHGSIDGIAGPETRAALTRFQTDYGLKVTGTITPEVLDAFKIVAQ